MSLCTVAGPPRKQLGRQVERRPCDAAALRNLALDDLSRAEVHQHQPAAGFAHDVLRLDVAVDQPGAVHRGHGAAQLAPDQRGLARAEGPWAWRMASSVRPAMNSIHMPTRPSCSSAP